MVFELTIDPGVRVALERRPRHRLASGVEVVDIYGTVGGGYMMALDGRVFEWAMEFDEREITDPVQVRLALMAGAKAMPELRRLIPARPAGARDCTRCRGTGKAGFNEQLQWLCDACGGVGWAETNDLVLVAEEQGWRFAVPAGSSVIVGRREEGVDVCLSNPTVASRHARVFEEGERWYVEDLGSHCGVYVNGTITRGSHPIGAGDRIRIGGVELRVESGR